MLLDLCLCMEIKFQTAPAPRPPIPVFNTHLRWNKTPFPQLQQKEEAGRLVEERSRMQRQSELADAEHRVRDAQRQISLQVSEQALAAQALAAAKAERDASAEGAREAARAAQVQVISG